jgi:ATP-dependent Clp protease protease subunit
MIAKIEINDAIQPASWGGINPNSVKAQLEDVTESDELEVYINSPGGDYFAGAEIAEAIRTCSAKKKRAYVTGNCASAATYAMLECDERWISPLGMILIHEPTVFAAGKAEALRAMAEKLDLITESLIQYYAEKLGIDTKQVDDWIHEQPDGHTFNAPEAIKYGWVKGVTTNGEKENADSFSKWSNTMQRTLDLTNARVAWLHHLQERSKK